MISSRSNFHILKVVLEAQSAHAIHTGHGDTTHDSLIVRDANGLPTLSGSSLAGVLRHQYQQYFGEQQTQALFGYAKGSEGQSSWLNMAWGLVHNSKNLPQEGLLSTEQLADPLLTKLLDVKPIVRQRVRLNEYGTTQDSGKFDVTLVPAGVRYTTWISYWCDGSEQSVSQWQDFINMLVQNPIRIGQGTRNGYGLFKIEALYQADWDLKTVEGQRAYQQRSRQRALHQGFTELTLQEDNIAGVRASLNLTAESTWRIGGGEQYLDTNTAERIPDLLPMHETKIEWKNDKGTFVEKDLYLLPASAIKGALRHRIAFHYNCLNGIFIDENDDVGTDENHAVKTLFGFTKDQDAHAGLLSIQDIYLSQQATQTVTHNKIDRYTGGVIRGALFSEHVLWNSEISIKIDILQPQKTIEPSIKQALVMSLEDLAQGWLPIGASGSRGLGVFTDETGLGVQWSDQQQWLEIGETA
ncbi:RAMP superfamily CRISPR-associated protein [Acinetobacter sichuanensis]|uniref:RAMP superfamily CRISPR-associated protein n=1 Tax=Acinetobacter sichuanensis TaxID=2136183 RepID=UPI00280E624C|nr:RAMP superfamily CRISPR-associated protein [Acinetobacter sichuanensis]MDQ9021836.1 RAMP superfamily CRISPR-associated protein [Acinetobacter sichuanensis]